MQSLFLALVVLLIVSRPPDVTVNTEVEVSHYQNTF